MGKKMWKRMQYEDSEEKFEIFCFYKTLTQLLKK